MTDDAFGPASDYEWNTIARDIENDALKATRSSRGTQQALTITATPFSYRDPSTIPLRPWLFGRWLLSGTVAVIAAPGGIGKSTWVAGMVLSLASGWQLLGKAVHGGKHKVWLWNLEDDRDELDRTVTATMLAHGMGPEAIGDRLFVDSGMEGAGLCTAREDASGFRIVIPVMDAVEAEIRARCISCLTVDPFVSSHAVDENNNVKIDAIVKRWGQVANLTGCAVVLVHHFKKPTPGVKGTAESARGASALTAAARTVLVLNRMDESEAAKFGIDDLAECRRYFSVQDDKHNRTRAEAADWYRLHSQSLGNGGADGGDSVGVAKPWTPPDLLSDAIPTNLHAVQVAVNAGVWRRDWQSPDWVGKAIADIVGLSANSKPDRARINAMLKRWIDIKALREVTRVDSRRRPRTFVEVGAWAFPSAPPVDGGAAQGDAVPQATCSTTTPFIGVEVVERSRADCKSEVAQTPRDTDEPGSKTDD